MTEIVSARVVPDNFKDFDHEAILFSYKVDGVTITAAHWSGRFDGSIAHLTQGLVALSRIRGISYITTTETQQKGALKAIRIALGSQWSVRKIGEYCVIYRVDEFSNMLIPRIAIFTGVRYYKEWRQMHVAFFNLRHKKLKRRFRLLVIHGPSDIEDNGRFQHGKDGDPKSVQVAKIGWPKVGRTLARQFKRNPKVVQVVAADSNANHHHEYFLNWFEHQTGAQAIWRKHMTKEGTHGGRLIDVAWVYTAK